MASKLLAYHKQHYMKRLLDITLAIFCTVIFSPVILVCALAVWRDVGRPVIFRQERIGKGGKPFMIYKFRSMGKDAEEENVPRLSLGVNDGRLTKTGRFLREHHLDELPQLWNVLKGDMSFVGYRPERKYFIDKIMEQDNRHERLYAMKPGVTSLATLYNGYTDSMEKMLKRLELDLYYQERHTLRMDLDILWRTFIKTITGKVF